MKQTTYPGINYAGRTDTNKDKETGIRFGVISQHSIMPEAFDDIWSKARDLSFESAVAEAKGKLKSAVEDYVRDSRLEETVESLWAEVEQDFSDSYDDCGERSWLYEAEGYKLADCLTMDVFVLKSPFFTFAQFCSPCVPGACNLDSPLGTEEKPTDCHLAPSDNRCYCLGHDFFENGKAPYLVFSVATGEEIKAQ